MMMKFSAWTKAFMALAACVLSASSIAAFPERPVRIVVAANAGGSLDLAARILADQLSTRWGQPVLVENRPGAGEVLAANQVVRNNKPDGYNLWLTASNLPVSPVAVKAFNFDLEKDFTPITMVGSSALVGIVAPGIEYRSGDDLVATMKRSPGKLNCTGSNGAFPVMQAAYFKSVTKTEFEYIPYASGSAAIVELMAGRVECSLGMSEVSVKLAMDAGKGHLLYVTGKKRLEQYPNIPTLAESKSPELQAPAKSFFFQSIWAGLVAPGGTPPDVVNAIYSAIKESSSRSSLATDDNE